MHSSTHMSCHVSCFSSSCLFHVLCNYVCQLMQVLSFMTVAVTSVTHPPTHTPRRRRKGPAHGPGYQSCIPCAWFTHVILMHMHGLLVMIHVCIMPIASSLSHFACYGTRVHWLFMLHLPHSLYLCMFMHPYFVLFLQLVFTHVTHF